MDEVLKQLNAESAALMWAVSAAFLAVVLDAFGKSTELKDSKFAAKALENIELFGKLAASIVAFIALAFILYESKWILIGVVAVVVVAALGGFLKWAATKP